MSSYFCDTVSRGSIYLHRVLEEHHGGASEPPSHGAGGSRGGFWEVVNSQGCTGRLQMRGGCHQAVGSDATSVRRGIHMHTPLPGLVVVLTR